MDDANTPDARARRLVARMTAYEKFSFLSAGPQRAPDGSGAAAVYPGVPRLGVPEIRQDDAGLGVTNHAAPGLLAEATALPSSLLLGASFDPAIAREAGAVLGREARARGFDVMLAGGANLVRDPRCGRNFEYVSEDPLLTGLIAGNAVAGIQSEHVVSTIKHFLLNAQETGRVVADAVIDEAALRESDLLAFQIAIETGTPGAVMTSYNLVNGTYTSEHAFLLQTVLKEEWRYPGWVMSDWGGTHSVQAVLAGLDVESGAQFGPGQFFGATLRAEVAAGRVPQSRIDDAVRRVLRSLVAVGALDPAPPPRVDRAAHHAVAQRAAERGIVLLRNEGGLLPASPGLRRILVVGGRADQGVLSGGGSSQVSPPGSVLEPGVTVTGLHVPRTYHPSPPLRAIMAEAPGAEVSFLDGKDPAQAAAAAGEAELVVLFATEWRSEGIDATGLALPEGQDRLIAAVAAANPRIVVVLETGGPVAMPWLDQVGAVLAAFYPGAGGGAAIAAILFGRVDPSGRLPCTFPATDRQLPRPEQTDPATTTSDPAQGAGFPVFPIDYGIEGADVGYRWFEREGLAPLFPFGFGLSFTRFGLSGLVAAVDGSAVTLAAANEGGRAGAVVVQAYVAPPGAQAHALAGFLRVELAPGERRQVTIGLERRLLARFDTGLRRFRIAAGVHRVRVGQHAADPCALEITLELAEEVLEAQPGVRYAAATES